MIECVRSEKEACLEPGKFLLLNEREIRSTAELDLEALAAVEDGFRRFAGGEAILPFPIGLDVPDPRAEVHVKTAYVKGFPGFAVKIASGFYENQKRGLPVSSGLMLLLSAETGAPKALLLDNAYLTEVRTALAGAIAAKHLAKKTIETVGVVGAGMQARMQLEALKLVREFRRALVYARRPEAALGYARDVSRLGIEVVPAGSLSELVRESDVVITATPAREALVRAEDVHPGLHVTAMGSDGPGKQELDPGVLGRADRIVCDSKDQCRRLGELQHARLGDDARVFELGQVAAGIAPGRESDREITVCDLTGLGVQDTAIANFVYERAIARGLGTTVNL
jgi:ornithine cyclodeaminase